MDSEIDLRDLLKQLWSRRLYILKATAIAMIAGLVVAFSIPREYICTVKMAPEGVKSSITGNMSNLAAIARSNIGMSNVDGIDQTLYPDVMQSMPFIAELIKIQLNGKGLDPKNTLYNYLDKKIRQPWWRSVLALPFKLVNIIRYGNNRGVDKEINTYNLTRKQDKIFEILKKRISISIDRKTGIIKASVTMQNPVTAAVVADSLVTKLERFVIDYRTNKAKQDFEFASRMFAESRDKYYRAQRDYASFVDANRNVILESVRIEGDRLKNELALAYNVYSTLAQKVETSRMKVQEQTPCVTIIEPASVPVRKSSINELKLMILLGLIAVFGSMARVVYSNWRQIQE